MNGMLDTTFDTTLPPAATLRRFWLNYLHLTAVVVLEFRQWLAMVLSLTIFLNLGMVFSFSFIAGSRDPAPCRGRWSPSSSGPGSSASNWPSTR